MALAFLPCGRYYPHLSLHSNVSCKISVSQAKQKQNYEKKNEPKLTVKGDDKVLLRNLPRSDRKVGKFSFKWFGPCTFEKLHNNGTVTPAEVKGEILKKTLQCL